MREGEQKKERLGDALGSACCFLWLPFPSSRVALGDQMIQITLFTTSEVYHLHFKLRQKCFLTRRERSGCFTPGRAFQSVEGHRDTGS
jgi:hypothetical protein